MVLNFNHKSTKGTKKKGWMSLAAVLLPVFNLQFGSGVWSAKLCPAVRAKMCRAGTVRRYPTTKYFSQNHCLLPRFMVILID